MKNEFTITFVVLAVVFGCLWVFSQPGFWSPVNSTTPNGTSQRDYQPSREGDCFVPPQGDPVYDKFYSQEVNPDNCKSLQDQSGAHNTDAQTKKTNWEIFKDQLMTYAFFGVMGVICLFLLYAALKGRG